MCNPDVVFPLNFYVWSQLLVDFKIIETDFVLNGLRFCFRLGILPGNICPAMRNCQSAYSQSQVIVSYLAEEIKFGAIVGPFDELPISQLHINRFGVIPKSTPGKFRLITDLSFPHAASVNDLIPDVEAAVSYTSIPEAISCIMRQVKEP